MKEVLYPLAVFTGGVIAWFGLRPKFKITDLRGTLPTRSGGWPSRSLLGVTDITIHHSAGGSSETIEGIANYHVNEKGWKGIGYHFVVDRDGQPHQVNDLTALSWHNGTNNVNAIGICVMGNLELRGATSRQYDAVAFIVDSLKKNKELPRLYRCVGHGEYRGHTSCPGRFFNMATFRGRVHLQGITSAPLALFSEFKEDGGYNPTEADHS